MTRIVCLVCTHAIEIGTVVFASNSKYIVCFNKFFPGKGFCEISSLREFIMLCNFRVNKFAYMG